MDGLVDGLSDRFAKGGVKPGIGGRSCRGCDGAGVVKQIVQKFMDDGSSDDLFDVEEEN